MNKYKFYLFGIFTFCVFVVFIYFRHFYRIERELPFTFTYLYLISTIWILCISLFFCYKLIKIILNINNNKTNFIIEFISKYFDKFIKIKKEFEYELFMKFRKEDYKYIKKLNKYVLKFRYLIVLKYSKYNLKKYIYFYLYIFPKILLIFTLFIDIVIFNKIYYILFISKYLLIHLIIIIIIYIFRSWCIEILFEIDKYFITKIKEEYNEITQESWPVIEMYTRDLENDINKLFYSYFIYYDLAYQVYPIIEFISEIYDIGEKKWVLYINLFLSIITISTWSYVLFKILNNYFQLF